jgi:transcription factor-like protein
MRNVGLLNAILALSVRHLSLNRRFQRASEQAQEPVDALPHYFKTLHYIQEAMQHDSYKNSQELLATASIVSAYEMLDGSRRDWERHLQGLFCIQRSQTIHGDSGGLKGAVWWAWLCQDVWAAFREGRRPLTFWRPDRVVGELAPHEMAARAVYLFAQAVAFCSKDDVARGQAAPLRRIAQADALRARLEEWRSHLGLEFEPIPQDTLAHGVFEPIWIHPPSHGELV